MVVFIPPGRCAQKVGFPKSGHICCSTLASIALSTGEVVLLEIRTEQNSLLNMKALSISLEAVQSFSAEYNQIYVVKLLTWINRKHNESSYAACYSTIVYNYTYSYTYIYNVSRG